jgi:hypothetical protein
LDGLISIYAAVPILISILDADQFLLKCMLLHPAIWRDDPAHEKFDECIRRYNNITIKCDACHSTDDQFRLSETETSSMLYGAELRSVTVGHRFRDLNGAC